MIVATDLSYTFHQIKNVVSGFGKESNPNIFSNSRDEGIFVRKIAQQIAFDLRQIGKVDYFFVAMDKGKPWRELVYEKYKGNRGTKEEREASPFDWKRFYEIQDHVALLLEQQGAVILKKSGAEADDLMFCLSRLAAKSGQSLVIITSDRDLYQCVSANQGEGAIVQFNNNSTTRKLVFAPKFHEWIKGSDEEDVFNISLDHSDSDILLDLYKRLEKLEVNQERHVFDKIIQGDSGDNVPAVFTWIRDSGRYTGNEARPSDGMTQKLWEKLSHNERFDTKSPLTDESVMKALHINLELVTKQKVDYEVLKQRYLENRTWMELHEEIIPSEIMQYVENKMSNMAYINKFDSQSLVKGSPWEKEVKMTLDLFKDLQIEDDIIIHEKKTNELF